MVIASKSGFTLIEVLIALVIIAILLTIALPSFDDTIVKSKVDAKANNLLRDFKFTRTEAIKRGISVTICPSLDAASCSGSTDYADGWLVFVDENENGSVDNGEELLRVVDEPETNITISGKQSYVCYNSNGLLC